MTPEQEARIVIDEKLKMSGWQVQNVNQLNLLAGLGVAVREFPTSTGPVDYVLFINGEPVGVIEAKKSSAGKTLQLLRSSLHDMQIVLLSGSIVTTLYDLHMRQLTS